MWVDGRLFAGRSDRGEVDVGLPGGKLEDKMAGGGSGGQWWQKEGRVAVREGRGRGCGGVDICIL